MRPVRRMLGRLAAVLVMILTLGTASRAESDVTVADLQGVARALAFLDGLPHDGAISIGIVYGAAGTVQARRAAELVNGVPGPNGTKFQPTLIPVETLSEASGPLNVLFLMPGVFGSAPAIIEFARRHHLLTVSDDANCLETHCCVLMVRSEGRVEVVLDTALADAVSAHFPSVFMMLVVRK
jgi:hypothetical protein